MQKDGIKVGFSEKLNSLDAEEQTYGCRANNPDICANNGIDNVCAFASKDGICRRPSKAWKKQFETLKKEKVE